MGHVRVGKDRSRGEAGVTKEASAYVYFYSLFRQSILGFADVVI